MTNRSSRTAAAVIAVTAAATLATGCSLPTSGKGAISDPPAVTAQQADVQTGTGSGVAQFGQQYTWPDKVAVQVSAPAPYKPSSSAANNTRGRAVVVTITFTNGGTEPYKFNSFVVSPSATHGGASAPQIFDTAKLGNDGAQEVTILPGKSLSYKAAFSVDQQPGDFQLELSEGFGSEEAIFAGTV